MNVVSHHWVTPAQFCHVLVCSVIKKGSESVSPLPWYLCGCRTEDGVCDTSPANVHATFQLMGGETVTQKSQGPCTLSATFPYAFFRHRQPQPFGGSELPKNLSKCWLWMRKTQKIEPDPNFFLTDTNFGLCVQWP